MNSSGVAYDAVANAVHAALIRRLPAGAACAVVAVDGTHPLLPAEAQAIAHAVPVRRREFAAGRAALRKALAAAGIPLPEDHAILIAPDRRPVLPGPALVSLAHDHGLAVAVVAPGRVDWRGGQPGIDIEPVGASQDGLGQSVAPYAGCDALTAFVAKEAAFKAVFPAVRRILDFPEMDLTVTADEFCATVGGQPAIRGQVFGAADRLIALAWHLG